LLNEITKENNLYIVKSNDQNIAVLLSYNDYQSFTESAARRDQAKKRFFEMVDKVHQRTQDVPVEEIEDVVNEAVSAAKKEELKEMDSQL